MSKEEDLNSRFWGIEKLSFSSKGMACERSNQQVLPPKTQQTNLTRGSGD